MSFDGSFSLQSALNRLLHRCPKLRPLPIFDALSQKGESLTSDELVAAIADPFLHPKYTIPVVGCFRPLVRKIVLRAIGKLRVVLDKELVDVGEGGDEVGEDDVYVVDFYVERERKLRLHEIASLAFCRALDLAPYLLSCVLSYFRFSPSPFSRLSSKEPSSYFTEQGISQLLDPIRVSYRFLLMDPKVFTLLWDWSSFIVLVEQQGAGHHLSDASPSSKDVLDTRWCTIQILSLVFCISDRVTRNFGLGVEEAFMCSLRWDDFCQDTSLEKAGYYFQAIDGGNGGCVDEILNVNQCIESFESDSSLNSYGVESKKRKGNNFSFCDLRSSWEHFVITATMKKSYEMVVLAVSQNWPVLLYGPAGSGKTSLVNHLADMSGNQVLLVHMDEQMDSKTLVGCYTCAERPGEFRWQPGSLTQAILSGLWVVFEDIDKAPNEVQWLMLPLLEGSSSFATGHGEVISVADNFRLFATISTSKHEGFHGIEGKFSFSALWRKVMIGTMSSVDMVDIINTWYPSVKTFSSKIVETFQRVNLLSTGQLGELQMGGMVVAGTSNRFSMRDLLKWCKRINCAGINFSGLGLAAIDCQKIYQEAVDIFAASIPSMESRWSTMREIGRMWGILEQDLLSCKPDIKEPRFTSWTSFLSMLQNARPDTTFWGLRSSLYVLERIACSAKYNEPVLLVGETGTGKTTLVQNLAMRLGKPLTVLNLSQQTDVADLLGGFKPTDVRSICLPLYDEFKKLFRKTYSLKEVVNQKVLSICEEYATTKKWRKLLKVCLRVAKRVCEREESGCGSKRKRPLSEQCFYQWESLYLRLGSAHKQIGSSAGMTFKFVEGAFITALRNDHWILLDEVNLAPPETLQRIIGVLDGDKGTLCLAERGDVDYVERHPEFRLFTCMNPATDAGKRELPYSFRSRFTEYFVDDILDDEDLTLFVSQYMDERYGAEMLSRVVRFYKAAKRESEERLQDGANQKPQFSLRSLARALEYTKASEQKFGFERAIYDGFCMFFLTLLDGPSAEIMKKMIVSDLLGGIEPREKDFADYVEEKINENSLVSNNFKKNYVQTESVKGHLRNLARAVRIKRYPVLLQGPTSSGKTSLVQYVAAYTGHEFVRINNHEHTDLQEYLGSYVTGPQGELQFQEGVLVKAVRNGYWIVLDELNLAPSDVLEALNRLLDDNRQIFVPETQETISAHADFMLFATQNPPMLYGGRKVLSRAFRNRFLEIHVDEIPEDELKTIVEKRCALPGSYASKMVEVMKDLQLHRQNSKAFAGKHGFITPRDLFRWARRFREYGTSYHNLARDGYHLLAERLRDPNERNVVLKTLQRQLRVRLVMDDLYKLEQSDEDAVLKCRKECGSQNITWTRTMERLFFLVYRCYKLREPVLLIGETGGGKTSVCQFLSAFLGIQLHILNCHQTTESSDFIGGFYPVRRRSELAQKFKDLVEGLKQSKDFLHYSLDFDLSPDISEASLTTKKPCEMKKIAAEFPAVEELLQMQQEWQSIFVWQDGPLVEAMKCGHLLLVDEISLADDSVLERLNSVLEPERELSLAEKGGSILEKITADANFFVLATMNPGGDYGKKELSPALRNRFTEIWVPSVDDVDELRCIAAERFVKSELSKFADYIVNFWQWFDQLQTGRTLTVRDLLSWVSFFNATEAALKPEYAFIHGAFLILLDGLSLGTGMGKCDAKTLRESSLSFLLKELKASGSAFLNPDLSKMDTYGWGGSTKLPVGISPDDEHLFGIKPFYIAKGSSVCKNQGFEFSAPTTCRNALRILRALQLPKPVLLEGSPGVGKTSLVVALAEYSGHNVVRINLSEQTDMMDLLGSDLPVEGENGMKFSWSDGILLQALKAGSWVLLDELNLAPQSVLEGLNAILDHRAEVYIPELGRTYKCHASFRVFACQNPSCQGSGRKGLPKSFLNRFTKVYVDELSADDYLDICHSRHPSIPTSLLSKLILFNNRLYEDTMIFRKYGQEGSPWEFNLRDVFRSCQIMEGAPENRKITSFLNIVYLQRMRTATDRKEVVKLYESVFGVNPFISQSPEVHVNPQNLIVGSARVERSHFQPQKKNLKNLLLMLPSISYTLEAVVNCVQYQWLSILVGPYSSGKTSLIRLLAQLTGNALIELNLSSGTDVSELLGCFEQYNYFRILREVISQVERYVNEYFALRLAKNWEDLIKERQSVFTKWLTFLAASKYQSYMPTDEFASAWNGGSCKSLEPLIETIEVLKADLKTFRLPISYTRKDLKKTLMMVSDLQQNSKIQQPAKFQWVSGDLMKAIECGDWVVLDNANLCNPTVLDRINSLVEPEGSITINECGLVNKKHVKLVAHPKFRLFLTVDPKHGEVSRAMRNRGLEIFMMQPNWWSSEGRLVHDFDDSDLSDVKRFLVLSGIPFHKLALVMSEAHMYAKHVGINLGVRITLLELNRWVQLFQHLLMNGNQPSWSLQLSWVHTYLSSLGEDGRDTILKAKDLYLSNTESFNLDPMSGYSLSMPGGWPSPQSVKNLVCYSTEACIRQNCAYLEFLGAQCTAYELSTSQYGTFPANQQRKIMPSFIPAGIVRYLLFANAPYPQNHTSDKGGVFLSQANQMLSFAANWTMEQATESDFSLYVQWFNWYNTQMQPYCHFFEFLEQERIHPIWNQIFSLRERIVSHYKLDMDAHPIPLLSTKLFELVGSDECMEEYKRSLGRAICCVPLLRLTYQQWKADADYCNTGKPLLELIRCLEKEVLGKILVSEELMHVYSKFLEHHIFFGRSLASSHFEHASIIWHWLKKEASKLKLTFPVAVSALLEESVNRYNIPDFSMNSETHRLWVHGCRPFLPSSGDVYSKMQQIYSFCDNIWQWKKDNTNWDNVVAMDILSANTELRQIATQAIGLSSYILTKGDQVKATIIQQLEELYQGLFLRFEHEKERLEIIIQSKESSSNPLSGCSITTCCTFSEEILCRNLKQLGGGYEIWMQTLPLFDKKSLSLDIKLLEELSKSLLLDPIDAYQVLLNSSDFLQHSLDYSLNFSSRSPVDLSPQQTLLWIFGEWNSIDSVHTKIASALHEMWFRWHSFLWNRSPGKLEIFPPNGDNKSFNLMLLTRSTIISNILRDTFYIKDFDMQCLKLRAVSRNLWEYKPLPGNLVSVLQSAADTIFKQIIFVHRKYFDENTFGMIKVTLYELTQRGASHNDLRYLKSLMSSSRHNILTSLVEPVVEALLERLYIKHRSCESLYHLGSAWFHIGVLRFQLLVNPSASDPAKKYALKHEVVVEKISLLELENKVRQECEHLTGRSASRDDKQQSVSKLQKLVDEQKQIQSKVVFRAEPSEYDKLRKECDDFLKDAEICKKLINTLKFRADIQTIIGASNWQDKALSFIGRLREAYAEYKDISQPVQVSIYEMKLGLSLAVSSAVEREYQKKIDGENSEGILATIYSLMQFPREFPPGFTPDYLRTVITPSNLHISKSIQTIDINFLKKLANTFGEVSDNKALQATVHHIILIHVAHQTCTSLLMDKASFLILDERFDHFVSLWLEMKSQNKVKEESDVQYVKFKPRLIDIPVTDSDESFASESTELLMEHEFSEMKQHAKEDEHMEEEWSLIPESMLKSLVLVHNQLFGSSGVVDSTGICEIAGRNRLHSFVDAYRLGSKLMKDLQALSSFTLDDCLMPEHVLYVSLQYEQTVGLTSQSSTFYNVYKDSNASTMSKMVKPLNAILEKVTYFLEEWQEHPGLQKILDLVNALLRIPVNTPVSKALLGLQLLVSRAQTLQENFSRFNLSDQLQPIGALVSSWQKLELECWPYLLDEVQEKYDLDAGKLWFPLRAVLHRNLSGVDEFDMFTVKSIEEFIQTSSVGEFNKRMQLLLAFHGQLNRGICLQAYTSPYLKKNMSILYNAFGYYVQYMPIVMGHIQNSENGRKDIERKLKECLKLFNWEHSSIETFRRTRQKMKKFIKQFNDVLQKPVMKILAEDAALKREKVPSWLEQKISNENNEDLLQFPLDIVRLSNMERFLWCEEWKVKADSALQAISGSTSHVNFLNNKGIADLTITSKFTEENCMIAWKKGWISLEMICQKAAEFAHEWQHGTKKNIKIRALGELLKTLEGCGLSKRRSMGSELETEAVEATSIFLQPSYDMLHLRQSGCCPSVEDSITHPSNSPPKGVGERSELSWETSNRCYFKNLGMLQQLGQIRHQFHNDLELEQVSQAVSFIDHLINIQQQQRRAAYSAFEQLKKLRDQMYYLSCIDMGGECNLALNQCSVLKCMWQQKHLFDNLLSMLKDVQLLLQCFKHSHQRTCNLARDEADEAEEAVTFYLLVDKFIPIFLQSKESLDKILLGGDGGDGTMTACTTFTPFIISKPMEGLVTSNFQILNNFEQDIEILCTQNASKRSVEESLLNRLKELLIKGKMIWADFSSEIEASSQSAFEQLLFPELNTVFIGNIEEINGLLVNVYRKVFIFQKEHSFVGELSIGNINLLDITLWEDLFNSYMVNLDLHSLHDALIKTMISASKLIDCAATRKRKVCSQIYSHLKHLYGSLEILLAFAENLLSEFLDAHKTIAEMTHVLAHIFILLFPKGFGCAKEPSEDNHGSENASGTGMGEGQGANDVSDQIEDDAQLLGTSNEKDGLDNSNQVGGNKDRGIEMDEDFEADTVSVSEDSGESDNEDEEDVNLESQIGETGENKQVVDEKLGDRDEGDKPDDNSVEKYESGPSVKETESEDREMRAKEDDMPSVEESELDKNCSDKHSDEDKTHYNSDGENDMNDMNLDKDNAFEEPTGIQLNEEEDIDEEQDTGDVNMEEPQDSDLMEEAISECDEEMRDDGEQSNPTEQMDDENSNHNINTETEETGNDDKNGQVDMESSKENIQSSMVESLDQSRDAQMEQEMLWSNSNDMNSSVAPSRSSLFDENPNMELSVPDSSDNSRLAPDQPNPQTSQCDFFSVQKSQSNPYRSIGDAMEDWKERVKVSVDSQEKQQEGPEDIHENDGDEYRYVSEAEKSTSQALGPATNDQINDNVEGNKGCEDEGDVKKDEYDKNDSIKENSETNQVITTSYPVIPKQKMDADAVDMLMKDDEIMEEMQQTKFNNHLGDMVSFKGSHMKEKVSPLGTLGIGSDLWKPLAFEELSHDTKQKAKDAWRRYELATAKLSQELAEQLRLVMEPTLASKLQGDYKTGKRINMKKVIPYIASQYRKDKIWLRRTRPNKRDYQVVVAIDDSRSMSESNCGNIAIESLVTVCRAMSQLEVGQFAVAGFGEKNKIKLLHDFDQPFTTEAGIKMISSLSFKQDNSIADEPVVDLLRYLNNMLDAAVVKARLPSGQNPLDQLILIIADGKFHENKGNLKRCVRDALNRKRMIVFVLLDSPDPKESIMGLTEYSFEGGKLSTSRYLNSFPFPYYILLKNMEALPRALADLLRQWFELMHSTSD